MTVDLTPTYLAENLGQLTLVVAGFDDLLLTGDTVDDNGHAFRIMAQDAETTWDNPVPVDVAVQRWMTDGAVASTQGHDNRSPYFKVVVNAANAADLAAGEAALAQRATQPGLLVWYPPSGPDESPASVFEVWTWHLEHIFDGPREQRLARMYGVRATAKPWVRSLNLTIAEALPSVASPTVNSIDTCSSLTGWTGSPNTPTLIGGGTAIQEVASVVVPPGVTGTATSQLTRTGSVTGLAATPFLQVDATINGVGAGVTLIADGVALTRVANLGYRSWFALPAGVTGFTKLVFSGSNTLTGAPGGVGTTVTATLQIAEIGATDTPGVVTSTKQLVRSLDVGGSVATSGSIQIASPSSTPLGTVVVHTCKDTGNGYSPPMRQYRSSGNASATDATAVSGIHENLVVSGTPAGTITYLVPPARLPEGTYAVLARVQSNTNASTATLTVQSQVQGGSPLEATSVTQAFPTASVWVWAVVGLLNLPPQALPAASTVNLQVLLSATSTATIILDELYLFDLTHGDLTVLTLDPATGPTRVWIDAPDANPVTNRAATYAGNAADRSDAIGLATTTQALALGDHDLDPGGALVFTVTDNVAAANVSATFYRRWHTHAGD